MRDPTDTPGQVASALAGISLRAGLVAVLAVAVGRMFLDRGWTASGWGLLVLSLLAGLGGAAAAGLCLGYRPPHGASREPAAVRRDRATAWCGGGISVAAALVVFWIYLGA